MLDLVWGELEGVQAGGGGPLQSGGCERCKGLGKIMFSIFCIMHIFDVLCICTIYLFIGTPRAMSSRRISWSMLARISLMY
jgi:hypothetical protein